LILDDIKENVESYNQLKMNDFVSIWCNIR